MAKQLNVNLSFTADTAQARAKLVGLQRELDQIIKSPSISKEFGLTTEIRKASVAAATLKTHLRDATNMTTGKLDLGQFNRSLQQSGISLRQYRDSILALGDDGHKTFAKLAQSITTAEVPLRRTGLVVAQFANTIKNAARWQISSGLIHSIAGSVKDAVGYARDLNNSLNSIRIVTGNSAAQMAEFAEQANKSAKALSTTTNEYTKASLIFAQQGLKGDEITKRTDTVMKMANVTGEEADEVSSYMTAIWNNFAKGSENLEHYADVITALGASTASSSEEIAGGLSKFASVADTIGLSYNYATSILSALVANTRQSADVIGTSLRTILARLQSVKLGDTLDDGVKLTVYTQALEKIGVNILDMNGELKDADTILDDVASKWETLSQAQKSAVSQTVAGSRQYAQFIAIMDNWGDVQKNLKTTLTADGTLQEQADIYAESWDAASNRVRASLESIYSDLVSDKFFIALMNGFNGALSLVDKFIDGLGGVKGVLLAISTIYLTKFQDSAIKAADAIRATWANFSGQEEAEAHVLRKQANSLLKSMTADWASSGGNLMGENYTTLAEAQQKYLTYAGQMSDVQKSIAQILLDQHATMVENANAQADSLHLAEEELDVAKARALNKFDGLDRPTLKNGFEGYQQGANAKALMGSLTDWFPKDLSDYTDKQLEEILNNLKSKFKYINEAFKEDLETLLGPNLANKFKEISDSVKQLTTDSTVDFQSEWFDKFNQRADEYVAGSKARIESVMASLRESQDPNAGAKIAELEQLIAKMDAFAASVTAAGTSSAEAKKYVENFGRTLSNILKNGNTGTKDFIVMAGKISSLGLVMSNVSSITRQWGEVLKGNASATSVAISTITSLGFTLTSVTRLIEGVTMASISEKVASIAAGAGLKFYSAAITDAATANTAFLLSLGGIGVALAAVAAVGYLVISNYKEMQANSPEGKLKAAQAAGEEAASAYDKVSKSVDDLKNTLKNLDSSYDNIKKLTKGTDEWYVAVAKVNKEVLSLLERYSELAKYISNEDGVLQLSQEGETVANQLATRELHTANLNSQIKVYNENKAREEVNLSNNPSPSGYKFGQDRVTVWNPETNKYDYSQGMGIPDGKQNETIVKALAAAYKDPRVRDNMFSSDEGKDAYSKAIAEALYGNLSEYKKTWGDTGGEKKYNEDVSYVRQFLDNPAVKSTFEENQKLIDSNEKIVESIITANSKIEGSLRDSQQIAELFKGVDIEEVRKKARDNVAAALDTEDGRFKAYQDYAKASGGELTYSGSGNTFTDSKGKNVKVSDKKIIDLLGDGEQLSQELSSIMESGIRDALSNIKNLDSDKLELPDLVKVDNLRNQFTSLLSEANIDTPQVDDILGTLGGDGKLSQVADDLTNINFSSAEATRGVKSLVEQLNSGAITSEQFANSFNKIAEQGKLEAMNDFFKNAAEGMGLKEEDANAMHEYANDLIRLAENSDVLSEDLTHSADGAADLAEEIFRMNQGVEALSKGFEEWSSILSESQEESQEYSGAMNEVKSALANVLDVEKDAISSDFVKDHLDEIKLAAEGDADAIDSLRASMDEEIVGSIKLRLEEEGKEDVLAEVESLNDQIHEFVENLDPADLEVGAILDDADFLDAVNNLISTSQMSADEANAYLAGIGYEPLYDQQEVEMNANIPTGGGRIQYQIGGENDSSVSLGPLGDIKLPGISYQIVADTGAPATAEGSMGLVGFTGDKTKKNLVTASGSGAAGNVKALRKKATGQQNNHSAANKGGKAGKKGDGGGKKGGGKKGGGGSEAKAEQKEHKELVDAIADRYHDLNEQVEDVTHSLNLLQKTQTHVFGKELIKSIEKENGLLERQKKIYGAINDELRKEQAELREKLSGYGLNASDSAINNYFEVFNNIKETYNAAVKTYNEAVDRYNGMSGEAQKEQGKQVLDAADKALDKAKKAYDDANGYLKRYDETIDELQKNEEKEQELLYNQIANNLKAFKVEIDLTLDTNEAERALNNFLNNVETDIKNLYKTTSEWLGLFNTHDLNTDTFLDDISTKLGELDTYKNAFESKDWGGNGSLFVSETEAMKAITDLEKDLIKRSEEVLNLYKQSYSDLRSAFGEVAKQFEEIISSFDTIDSTLDHYEKIVGLLYGEDTDSGMNQLAEIFKLDKENSIERQKALQSYKEALETRKAEALAKGYEEDDAYIKEIQNEIDNANKNLQSEIEKYLDTIKKELENANKMAKSQMDKNIWGKDISSVNEQWSDKVAQAEGYYDTVEKIYQLESLTSKWKNSINSASSLKMQQQLTALMEKQLNSLKEKKALSEKDIELAEKELAIYQAQAALEDAQNNKNALKVTRDETGNWTYQYVADEDDLAAKQQDYLDKINEWRTASINAAEEIGEKTASAYETFSEKMTEIMNNVTLSEEERTEKIKALNETYWGSDGIITKLVEDSNFVQGMANRATYIELAALYQQDQDNFAQMSEAEKAITQKMIAEGITSYESLRDYIIGDDGKSGVYGEINALCKDVNAESSVAWKSMAADAIARMYKDPDSVRNMVSLAYAEMEKSLQNFDKAVVRSERASGIEWSKVNDQLGEVRDNIDLTADKVDDIVSKVADLSDFEDAVLRIKDAWEEVADQIREATADLQDYFNMLGGGSNRNEDATIRPEKEAPAAAAPQNNNNNDAGTGAAAGGGDGNLSVGEEVTYTGGLYYYDSEGTTPTGKRGPGRKVKITKILNGGEPTANRPYPIHVVSEDSAYGWLTKDQLSGFDTGGYTGDWLGKAGKLALLHAKELVLNAKDTENILSAVDMVRQMSSIGNSISSALSNMMLGLTGLGVNRYGSYNNSSMNNATNVFEIDMHVDGGNPEEIKRAILDLPNLAAQFLNRN